MRTGQSGVDMSGVGEARSSLMSGRSGDLLYTVEMSPSTNFGRHCHPVAQLSWPQVGAMRVDCGSHSWLLRPDSAVWIPSGATHDVYALAGGCTFRSLYLWQPSADEGSDAHPPWSPGDLELLGTPRPLSVEPLLLGLTDVLDDDRLPDDAERARLESVMFDRLRRCLGAPSWPHGRDPLPMPVDDRASAVAVALLDTLDDDRDLAAWGRTVGASARTLRRIWVRETGLPFRRWRSTARLQRADELVRDGLSVADVARVVGYSNPGSFSDAFMAHFGWRPTSLPMRDPK